MSRFANDNIPFTRWAQGACFGVLLGVLGACGDGADGPPPFEGPPIVIEDVDGVYSDSGYVLVTLQAPLQWEFENGEREFPEGMLATFYSREGQKQSALRANCATYDSDIQEWTFEGKVDYFNYVEKTRLRSEILHYRPDNGRIYTNQFVRIDTPAQIIKGTGLETNSSLDPYRIREVSGEFDIDQAL